MLPDGKYKMRLRINYAYGDTKIYDEEFYIKNNPEHLIENIKIYPNPAKNGKMVIAYTPNYQCDVTVDIYSVSGRKVTTLCNEDYLSESINWNCKNKDAKDVASGIYFIVIKAESSGKREIYKPLKSAIIK